ncbi:hydrolase [Pseudogulbenkiania sp. MAI-1]|uniref:hydrolase n=1 Tax=Pseudogulbenkiania sp. MAI-1 TaxID=990370 RepID=UPI00045EB0F4|nr:hydrolase [Pseudogulbenkiania sp. MAI-1]
MLMQRDNATLLVVDVQQKLVPAVVDPAGMIARVRWLLGVAHDTGLPVVFSEQYPQGLGHTVPELLAAAPAAPVVAKRHFSCVAGECLPDELLARPQVIVCGMETHVCVLQTVLELLEAGKQVFVVADAVASRSPHDIELGLQRMRDAGAVLVSREMVLFELLREAGTELFRAMSKRYLQGEQP